MARRFLEESDIFSRVSYARRTAPTNSQPNSERQPKGTHQAPPHQPQTTAEAPVYSSTSAEDQPQTSGDNSNLETTHATRKQQEPSKPQKQQGQPQKQQQQRDQQRRQENPHHASPSPEARPTGDHSGRAVGKQGSLAEEDSLEPALREVLGENSFSPLFSWTSEAFLSAEDASQEQSSIDDPPSQVLTRKTQATTKKRKKAEVTPPEEPCDSVSPTTVAQGAIPKRTKRNSPDLKGDGQHSSVPSCGCHTCIKELCITKMISITPGLNPSKKLRDLVSKRRLFKQTRPDTHPDHCLCKSHLERAVRTSKPTGQKTKTHRTPSQPPPNIPPNQHGEVATILRDTRLSRSPPKGKKSPPNKDLNKDEKPIDVITSR